MAAATTRPPLPLTTLYTPPASCSDIVTWNGEHLWQYGVNQTGGECYPPQFKRIFNSFYTPGVCPDAWTSAGAVSHSVGFDAMCCPEGFFLSAHNPGYDCNSIVTSTLDNVYRTTSAGNDPIPSGASLTKVNPRRGAATVTADVIQVRWQNKDSNVASLMAQKTSNGTAGGAETGTQSNTSSTNVSTSESSGGMSTGAKIGIGVAVPIIVLSLLAIGAVLIWRKRKQKAVRDHEPTSPTYNAEPFHELSSQEQKYQDIPTGNNLYSEAPVKQPLQAPQEMEAQQYNELPAGGPVQELSGQEMQRASILKSDSVHSHASSNPKSPRKGLLR